MTLTSLRLTNSPKPNGLSGAVLAGWLMNTMPVSIRMATSRPRSVSRVNTDAPSPNGVAFASATASSSVSTV